jgi:biotin carboxyl carrier protein
MPFTFLLDGEPSEIEILARKPRLVLMVNGRLYTIEAHEAGASGVGVVRIDGESITYARALVGDTQFVRRDGYTFEARVASLSGVGAGAGGGADAIKAPMPGVVIRLHRMSGDAVTRGETVITIESMKLQMALAAPRDGVIADLCTHEGGIFDKDAILARLVSIGEQ